MDKFVIIGLGVFGRSLAENLAQKGTEVIAVDRNMELVEEIRDLVTYSVCMDSTDDKALESLGLNDVDVGIVCIGENFEANLLTSVLLKHNGVKKVISRASDPLHIKILKAVGIDQIITPGVEAAEKLAYGLIHKSLLDISYISETTAAAKISVPASFAGKTLGKLNLRARFGINVVAIHRMVEVQGKNGVEQVEKVISNIPGADTVIESNDILVVIGETENLDKVMRAL
ncbi:MAG TPA: TrkA family potassium uptake protein [Chitinispirillaceae bacterium]|jgi:trk system potassium uptake protein TrkA|nr:TrkA family potassium uptake protein [Chitinispirillaceae bacterium]